VSLANPRLTHPPLPQVKNRLKLHKESASTSNAEDYLPDGIDRRIAEAEAAAEREREERKRAKKEAKEAKRTAEGEEGGMDPDMMAMMGFGGFGSSKK
jgi:U4/U6.U5 tri-snRNP component SNU23